MEPLHDVAVGGVKLRVLTSDRERALEILQAQREALAAIPLHCPRCDSPEVVRGIHFVLFGVVWFAIPFGPPRRWLRCRACKHAWEKLPSTRPFAAMPALLLAGIMISCVAQPRDAAARLDSSFLLSPDASEMNQVAPAQFQVRLQTSEGDILIELNRDWAPLGVDRFYNLVRAGYYDGVRFTRVIGGRWAQFGINGDPRISQLWRARPMIDDPLRASNLRGTLAYAFAVPNGRTTQLFINLQDNSPGFDVEPFVPIGRIVEGMAVADALNAEYGEDAGGGIRGGRQGPLFEMGTSFLMRQFPRLDYIQRAVIVDN